ncbi:MAG: hypothetical protein ACJ77M_14790, partial [Thermoleophilaceae bacterium]
MTRRRLLKFVLPAVAVVALSVGVALAFFSSTGTGSPTVGVASLAGPGNVTTSVTPGQSDVSVDWDATTLSDGRAVDGYYVTKTDPGTTTTAACGSSASSLITSATDCSDTSVPDGIYTYHVIAVFGSFTGTGNSPDEGTHVATETDTPSVNIG